MLIRHDVLTKCLQKKDWFRNLTLAKSSTDAIIRKAWGKPERNKENHKQSRELYRLIPFKSKIKVTNRSSSLRKKPTLRDAIAVFHAKWRLRNDRRNSILMTCHYPDLGGAFDWLKQISLTTQPIRSTNQIWVVTHHQYGISALVTQTSFHGETSGGVAKFESFLRLPIKPNKRKKIEHDQNRYDTKLVCFNTWIQVWDIRKSGPLA